MVKKFGSIADAYNISDRNHDRNMHYKEWQHLLDASGLKLYACCAEASMAWLAERTVAGSRIVKKWVLDGIIRGQGGWLDYRHERRSQTLTRTLFKLGLQFPKGFEHPKRPRGGTHGSAAS